MRSPPIFDSSKQAASVIHGGSIEQYKHIVANRVARIEVTNPCKKGFNCHVTENHFGQIQVTHIQSDPVELIRTEQCIASDKQNHYLVGLNLAGDMLLDHYRYSTTVESEQMFLLDTAVPYQSSIINDSNRIMFAIPRRLIESRLPEPMRYFQATPSISSGVGSLVYRHLQLLMNEGHQLNDITRMQVVEMCMDLIALSFRSFDDSSVQADHNSASCRMLLSRIKAHLHCVLGDPELNPENIAESLGLSKRYLHKLFSDGGTTFSAWVRDERLMRVRTLLADPRFHYLSIKEIALQQGFNDIPNFSRQFKAKFNQTPSDLRSNAIQATSSARLHHS